MCSAGSLRRIPCAACGAEIGEACFPGCIGEASARDGAWTHGLAQGDGPLYCCARNADCDAVGTADEMQAHYDSHHAASSS